MRSFKLNPLTVKKINRFKSIKRGYYSFIIFSLSLFFAMFAEFFVNSKAILVKYEGNYHFPTYSDVISGETFGLDYKYETNYRELNKQFESEESDNFVIMPVFPYNPLENDLQEGIYPPTAPNMDNQHFLGTDTTGRDILARLVYGYRIAIVFSLGLLLINYVIGITIGCLMGFYGGWFDIIVQRIIEIWSNIPFLYVVIIVSSIVVPSLGVLMGIMAFFGWMGMTWYMRTKTYKEKEREYVLAARALGAKDRKIIFSHIIPNSISLIVTFIPFSIAGGMTSLTSLDYLGFGLLPPTPSWGELLSQGTSRLDAPWIGISVVFAMILILTMITFIGEAIREAFDPKKHTTYQ
ncbi:MAG: ABC transporter permease subunit [Bacteriovoracaceae bacterium]|jgi:microcin C transport system permease protein|nr:ABC transporter permease subunit [Bacteriovoracaceae bacterium]